MGVKLFVFMFSQFQRFPSDSFVSSLECFELNWFQVLYLLYFAPFVARVLVLPNSKWSCQELNVSLEEKQTNNDQLNLHGIDFLFFSEVVHNWYFILPLVDGKGYKTGQSGELFATWFAFFAELLVFFFFFFFSNQPGNTKKKRFFISISGICAQIFLRFALFGPILVLHQQDMCNQQLWWRIDFSYMCVWY